MTSIQNLYSDGLISITEDAIIFHNYYFFGVSRTVHFNNVESIEARKPTVWNGKWRFWGSGSLGVWFPMDFGRASRDRIFYLKQKGKMLLIGFTVKDSFKVESIFRERGLMGRF
jgi:hypothetical protein